MTVFRVCFQGTALTNQARVALDAAEAPWEGSEAGPDGPCRHRALVQAGSEQAAIRSVREALAPYVAFGSYLDFTATPVRDSRGELWRDVFHRSWQEVDWDATPRRAGLTSLQRDALGCLLDAAEPTWIVARELELSDGRAGVIAVLRELEAEGFVHSTVEEGGEPGREREPERWWAITDEGWDLLGLIKSPSYR
jgi:hypothetical protein